MTVQSSSLQRRYALAVISIMLATGVRVAFNPILGAQVAFSTFYMAILLATWYGGFGPGLVALILGGLCANYFIMLPQWSFEIDGLEQQVSIALYFVIGFGIALLGGVQRFTRDQLEARVVERTAALSRANDAFRASEEKFRFLISDVLDYAIFTLDTTGHVTTWNTGAERNKGYRAEEIIGQHFSRFYPPEEIASGKPEWALQTAVANGRCEYVGWRVRNDGSRFWARVVILALKDDAGQLRGFAKITRDITETKQADERFRQAVESAPNGMVMVDSEGLITLVNAQTEKLFGYNREELLGQPVELLIPERLRESHPADRARFMSSPQVRSMGIGRDLNARRKDGSEFPVEIGLNPISTSDGLMVLSAIVDITERKRSEAGLRESEARFRQAVESAPNGMVMVDSEGLITLVNAQTEKLFGYNREELLGQPVELLIPERLREIHPADRARFMSSPQVRSMGVGRDLNARRKDGSEFPVEIGLNPIHTADGLMVLSAIVDITARKLAEQSLQDRERFLRIVTSSARVGLVVVNDQYEYLFANEAYAEIFDLEDQQIVGHRVLDVLTEAWPQIQPRLDRALAGERVSYELILPARSPAIDQRWFRVGYEPRRDETGKATVVVVVVDITERKRAEEELRESEERFRMMVNSIPQLAWVAHADGSIFWYNQRWYDYTGTTLQQMEGWGWQSVHDPEQLPLVMERWQAAINAGKPLEMEFPLRGADGQLRTFLTRVEPFKDSEGRVVRWFGTNTDIDAIKQLEGSLRAAQARLTSALSAGSIGTWTWDIVSDRLIADDFTARMFSVETSESAKGLPAESYIRAILEEDQPGVVDNLSLAIKSCGNYDIEYRVRQRNGELVWLHAKGRVEGDADGKAMWFHGAVMDITGRKRAEEWLRRREEQLRVLGDNLPGGAMYQAIVSPDGTRRATYMTAGIERLLGIPPAEALADATALYSMILPEDIPTVQAKEAAAFAALSAFDCEFRSYTRAGDVKWLHSRSAPRPQSDGTVVWDGIVMDVTSRKLAESELHRLNTELEERVRVRTAELEVANKEMEAFSYSVSHDLRAPLRGIDGFSRILLKKFAPQLPPQAQEYLNDVRANSQQMGRLVDDLLAFSRLGRKPVERQHVVTAKLVNECLKELAAAREGRQVELRLGELPDCEADPALLKQVWLNLLANAIKYSGKQELAVIEIGSSPGTDGPVYFVKDNGVGFDMQYAHKLFGVFQRLHKAEDYEGTGVGLAIVQRIINRHGGRVWAEAEPNKGATFYFTLSSAIHATLS